MGRPLDAVAALVGPGVTGDDAAAAMFDLVAAAVRRGPTVLVVEDLHWVDAASANLIDRIAQQPWPNLVVIATYRPNDLSRGQPGGELVLRLERRHSVEQVRLDRLDRTEVGAMVAAISLAAGGQPSSAFIEALHRRSAGIPFVVEELMRVVGPRPMVSDLLEAELPWSLEEAVRQQLAGLEHGRRRVVEALAVYGRAASFEALLVVTEADRRRPRSTRCARSSAPASSSRSATTSSGSPTPSSPTPSSTSCSAASGAGCTSAASRPCAGRPCSTTPRWRTTPRAPTATTRCPASPGAARRATSRRG